MGTMLRLILTILLIYFLVRSIKRAIKGDTPKKVRPSEANRGIRDGGILVEDPYCHTYIPRDDTTVTTVIDGETRYFCSERCREEFLRIKGKR